MAIILKSPHELAATIAIQAKEKRLALNLSQKTLSDRSGVKYGTLRKFERTGQISLESLLKLALVLDALDEFDNLFTNANHNPYVSLDKLIKTKSRKRGRK